MKKLMVIVAVVAVAAVAAWNFNQSSQVVSTSSDLTLENLEAIAQGRGSFPTCQKSNPESGDLELVKFCVSETECKQTMKVKYGLDVNYCSQKPSPIPGKPLPQ